MLRLFEHPGDSSPAPASPGPPMQPVQPLRTAQTVDDIVKSPQDKKAYRYVKFSNGLVALLVHDPEINGPLGAASDDSGHSKEVGHHEDECSADEMEQDTDSTDDDMDEDESEGSVEECSEQGSDGSDGGSEEGGESDGAGGTLMKKKKKMSGGVKKAAAAMAVGIGSLSDPPIMQGLSHYLEHMLFMGSEKYPDENDYDDYITKHGGTSNAFTELELTNYHFEVAPDALQGALDRFAQFFISPLMLEGSLEREVLAVDSEFSGVQQSDACRISQLMCHTSRPSHPYRQFSWGNKKSLWDQPLAAGLNIRQHIKDYYMQHYTAERMSLVVLGGEPLDTLQQWVAEVFAGLPAGKGPRPSFDKMPMPFQGRHLYVMPAVQDHHEVSLTFQLPCLWPHYTAKAEHYVAHLVGHEGPGSLLSYLKSKGWATEVCAGIEEDGYSQNSGVFLFSITIGLTDAGLSAAPGCGLAAVGAAFTYLRMLSNAGPQEWIWREMAQIADIKFRYQEEEESMDLCTKLASGLHIFQPRHALCADYVHDKYDPDLINRVMSALHPSKSEYRIDLLTRQYSECKAQLQQVVAGSGAGVTEDREPWFGLETAWTQIPEALSHDQWQSGSIPPDMHLPPANPYIATDFTVWSLPPDQQQQPSQEALEAVAAAAQEETSSLAQQLEVPLVLAAPPTLVHDKPGLRVWHKLDRTFNTPRANVYLRLCSPHWHDSPRSAALTHLALKLLEDALNEESYLADVAGLHFHTAPEGMQGVELKVDGFSHKLPVLVSKVLQTLSKAEFPGATWATVHEALSRKYRNMNMQVHKHANYDRLYALCQRAIHYSLVESEINTAGRDSVTQHVKKALTSCHLEVFIHGNLTLPESLQLAVSAQTALGAGCMGLAADRVRDCCVQLPEAVGLRIVQPARNTEEENCAVEMYYQVGEASSPHDRAILDLIDQVVYEPAYNTLRTQQQLGYTVHTGSRLTHGIQGFCVVVVSSSHTAAAVDQCVEDFLRGFEDKLQSMTEAELQEHKTSLTANKLTRDRALSDESSRHWDHIWNERYDFFAREKEVAALEGITLQQVQTWWRTHLSSSSPLRRKLAVHILPTKACPAHSPLPDTTAHQGPLVPLPASQDQPVAHNNTRQEGQRARPTTRASARKAGSKTISSAETTQLVVDVDSYKKQLLGMPVEPAALPAVKNA